MASAETNLCFLTIREAGEMMLRRELSPVELTRAFLDRIDATDGQLHSFITLLREEALAEARVAEAEILRGDYRGSHARHPHRPEGPVRHRRRTYHHRPPGCTSTECPRRTPRLWSDSGRRGRCSWASW